jgi:hypothetical protein
LKCLTFFVGKLKKRFGIYVENFLLNIVKDQDEIGGFYVEFSFEKDWRYWDLGSLGLKGFGNSESFGKFHDKV